ncbi:MAG: hypothetical protein RLW61_02405 [Gammaproteobacteria bacterium]
MHDPCDVARLPDVRTPAAEVMTVRRAPLLFVVLLVLAVPWYWPADDRTLWFGVPAWVCVAVVVSAAASLLTALLMARPWPDEQDDDG